MASKQAIDSFLSCRRIAVVGVSRDPKDFSRQVFRAFVERGYDAVPVNAAGGEVEGRPVTRRVGEVQPPPGGGPAPDATRRDRRRWSASASRPA